MPKNNTSFNVKVETGQEVNGEILTLLRGYSPYELALKDGFVGTEEEWLASLVGEKGETGNGIENVVLNDDYTLTIFYTNGDQYTTSDPIRGEKGETGNGIKSATLNPDYTLTLLFTDGGSYTTIPIRGLQGERGLQGIQGIQGETGNGISRVKLNPDYTLTIYFTDGTSNTTSPIRGAQGEKGETGNGIKYATMNLDYTLTIKFTDGSEYTTPVLRGAQGIQGMKGDVGNGIDSAVLNSDYTLTLNFTDGTSYTTAPIRGQAGERGEQGVQGEPGNGIAKATLNPDYTLTLSFTDGSSYTTSSIRGMQGIQGIQGANGADGVGIASATMNQDYTLTLLFTDGTHYTTPSLRGATGSKGDKGDTGNGIDHVQLNNDYTLTFYFDDGTQYTTASVRGEKGEKGEKGDSGDSPKITTTKSGKRTTIYADGSPIGTVDDGDDGTTPSITASKSGSVTTISVNGNPIAEINDGTPGQDGDDGYSPSASVSKSGSTTTITITDKNGTTTAEVHDGQGGTGTIDPTPTEGSTNAVSSGGVYDELSDVKNDLSDLKSITTTTSGSEPVTDDLTVSIYDGYKGTNGQVYHSTNYDKYGYTSKIPVAPGNILRGYRTDTGTAMSLCVILVAYNGNTIVSGTEQVTFPYTVPDGVDGVEMTLSSANKAGRFTLTHTTEILVPVYKERIEALEESIEDKADESELSALADSISGKVDKSGIGQVKFKNCDFVWISKNLFNLETISTGLLVVSTGAVATNYTSYIVSDWIPVESETDYTFSQPTNNRWYYCWYNSNKGYISGEEFTMSRSVLKTSPANAAYLRISLASTAIVRDVQVEKGSEATRYYAYGDGYILPQYIPQGVETFPLNLPEKIYALAGMEMNIYFDNLVDGHDTDYEFDVTCSVGMQMDRCYRITTATAGTYTLSVTAVRKRDRSSVTKSATLIVASANAGSGATKTMIILGDSTTDSGTAVSKLHENFSNDVMDVTTLGTRGTSPNNHEGRGGWKFYMYCTRASSSDGTVQNPFYNTTSQTFDASYYFTNTGIAKPDWFVINLGINDMFGATNDAELGNEISQAKGYCDTMLNSIKSASPSTKIMLCLTIPPSYYQDGFGKEYGCGQNRNRYKRNNILWVEKLIEEYGGRESENIYLVPLNLALDTVNNMGTETIPVNARNTSVTYKSSTGNGAVHPVASGYWQIADVYTAFLKANV